MTLTLDIPDSVVNALNLPPEELRKQLRIDLAVALYSRGALSEGKAAEFAGIGRMDFEQLLCERRVERPFTMEELERDLAWAEKHA